MVTKAKTEDQGYVNPLAIDPHKPDERRKVKVKEVLPMRALQSRVDVDTGLEVDEARARDFAAAMKEELAAGKKIDFPPVKLMLVEDAPGHKGKPVLVPFDGLHTHAGAEIAKVEELDALIWKGTFAQARAAAATLANVEHAKNGKPKSYKDKLHSLHMFAKALQEAEVPKKNWPSNRQAAELFGISHTAVGNEDPFGRRQADSKTGEQIKAEKKAERAAAKTNGVAAAGTAHLGHGPAVASFEILRRDGGEVVATIPADSAAKALEAFKRDNPAAVLTDHVTREVKAPPKPGSEKTVGFDWTRMEGDLGAVARGLDAMGDIYDLKGKGEFRTMKAQLNSFTELFRNFRKESAKKPVKAAESEPKKVAAAATTPPKEKHAEPAKSEPAVVGPVENK